MAAPVDISQFKEALIVLGSAALVIPVFHRLKLSPVLGYILIGMVVGPYGIGSLSDEVPWLSFFTIAKEGAISHAAEFGIVLLMFMIGLELSLERLLIMRRLVFGLGSFQLLASAAAIGSVTYLLTSDVAISFIVGLALAMSSTAIVTQVLSQTKQLGAHHGRASFAVLIFQDIAVIPIMFAVGIMGASTGGSMLVQLGAALLQAGAAIALVILSGRMLLRPLFRRVAATQSPELFMAACLLVILAISVVTALAGLSMALGALMAGLLLAETEYRRQIEYTIEPFKGLMVGVFLISAGMNVDLARILLDPLAILLASMGLVLVKALVVVVGGQLFRVPVPAAARAGLLLGPGSEFTFVIVALAVGSQVLPAETGSFVLIVAALTMALIPALHGLGRRVERLAAVPAVPHAVSQIKPPEDEARRVIIAGFGRVGRVVAELLRKHDIPFLAVDSNVEAVAAARDQGYPVYFGDIKQPDFMRLCGIGTARALVLTMDSPKAANVVVQAARAQRHDLVIIARARDGRHASELYRLGATDAVPETIEASLQLAEVVLVDVGIAMGPAIASIHEKRAELRGEIQAMAPGGANRAPPRRRLREAWPNAPARNDDATETPD
ncbi:MAG: cation:proton antiporter [Alphaproteobacteria bacterium]|nr:cation:proton antiporter [Alphaproteobacteria bacterium]